MAIKSQYNAYLIMQVTVTRSSALGETGQEQASTLKLTVTKK